MSLVRGTLWVASATIVLAGSRFVLSVVLARRLGVEGFGAFAYSQWLVDIAFLVCSLGATGVAARYYAEYQSDPGKLLVFRRAWLPWAIACPLVSALAACVGGVLSGLNLSTIELTLLGAWTVSASAWALRYAVTIAKQRFSQVFAASVIFALIAVGGSAFLPLDLGTALALIAVAHAASAVILSVPRSEAIVVGTTPARLDLRAIRLYAVNIWITALLWGLVWSRGEYPVIRFEVGDTGLAQYAVAIALFGGAAQAVMLWVGAIAPELTRLLGEGSKDRAMVLARRFSDLQLLVSAALAIGLAAFSKPLVEAVFGPDYSGAGDALALLAPGLIGFAIAAQNHLLQMMTNARFNRNASLVGLFVLFGVALLLTPSLGIEGGAMARLTALLSVMGLTLWRSRSLFGRDAASFSNFCAAAAIALIVAAIEVAGGLSLAWSAALAGTATVVLLAILRDGHGLLIALALRRNASAHWNRS